MILLSVGTQLPFDRLLRAVDGWAETVGDQDIIAQVGTSQFTSKRLQCVPFINPQEFRTLQEQAQLHIAHAGMGSILTAMELGKPILIMPRDHTLGEHRNGHQLATAKRFSDTEGVFVAFNERELIQQLKQVNELTASGIAGSKAPEPFITNLRALIDGASTAPVRRDFDQPRSGVVLPPHSAR